MNIFKTIETTEIFNKNLEKILKEKELVMKIVKSQTFFYIEFYIENLIFARFRPIENKITYYVTKQVDARMYELVEMLYNDYHYTRLELKGMLRNGHEFKSHSAVHSLLKSKYKYDDGTEVIYEYDLLH